MGAGVTRLTALEPQFVRYEDQPYTGDMVPAAYDTRTDAGWEAWRAAGQPTERRTEMRERQTNVDTLAEAQGVIFRCPTCTRSHHVGVAFAGRGVLDHHGSHGTDGKPSRWQVSGTGYDDLTLSPSVDCTHGGLCTWHGWVKNGEAS